MTLYWIKVVSSKEWMYTTLGLDKKLSNKKVEENKFICNNKEIGRRENIFMGYVYVEHANKA